MSLWSRIKSGLGCDDEPEHLRHLGVPELDGERVVRIVEKPEQPPSGYAVTGVYFYDETVWEVIPHLEPSGRGELEITDVNNYYLRAGTLQCDRLAGWWTDAGTFDSLAAANELVRRK